MRKNLAARKYLQSQSIYVLSEYTNQDRKCAISTTVRTMITNGYSHLEIEMGISCYQVA